MMSDFPYYKEPLIKERICSLWGQILSFNPSNARGEYCFLYVSTPSFARGKHSVVYVNVVSTIIFKGQNSIILICSIMKELSFPRFIS